MAGSPLLIGAKSREERMLRMGVARIAVGLTAGVSPRFGARVFGAPLDEITTPASFLARLFAVRNLALGAWTLMVRDRADEDQRRCVQVNLAVDALDFVVVLPYLLRRGFRRAAFMSAVLANSAALGWYELLDAS